MMIVQNSIFRKHVRISKGTNQSAHPEADSELAPALSKLKAL